MARYPHQLSTILYVYNSLTTLSLFPEADEGRHMQSSNLILPPKGSSSTTTTGEWCNCCFTHTTNRSMDRWCGSQYWVTLCAPKDLIWEVVAVLFLPIRFFFYLRLCHTHTCTMQYRPYFYTILKIEHAVTLQPEAWNTSSCTTV